MEGHRVVAARNIAAVWPKFMHWMVRGGALVGMEYGFMGPNYSISTACATANYCFVAAANHIRNGDADMILAGGSEAPIIPVGLGGFVACRCVCARSASVYIIGSTLVSWSCFAWLSQEALAHGCTLAQRRKILYMTMVSFH